MVKLGSGKTHFDYDIIDADGTYIKQTSPVGDDTQVLTFVSVYPGTFFPNPKVTALGLRDVEVGEFIGKEQAEKDTEALLEHDRRMRPPPEFRVIESTVS